MTMRRISNVLTLLSITLLTAWAPAQTSGQPSEGVTEGGYNIHQSIEFGGRISDFSGSEDIWSTFVNQHSGPRLLEQSLDMGAVEHAGILFDRFSFYNAGYGGDPNNISRLKMAKNKWYTFSVNFRRDRNFWNYDLLANPLNPPTTNPAFPSDVRVLDSPHNFETVRRMTDYSLTLLPLSRVRFRLGYFRNVNEGPTFSSFHEGTDVLLSQPWRVTSNSYQIGVDFKEVFARTNVSYDQFFQSNKGDTRWVDANQTFVLPNGVPVDLGLILDATARQPCVAPLNPPQPPTVDPTCNGYIAYSRFGPSRVFTPTQQLSFQSSYFKRLDAAGRFSYSSGENELDNFLESFIGLVTRTRQRTFDVTGPAKATRVSVNADIALTGHITDRLRLVESFRWADFRIPGQWSLFETSTFGTSMIVAPNTFPSAACPAPFSGAGCPQHASSSPADITAETFNRYLGQDAKVNTVSVDYDFSRRFTGHVGYRYRHRDVVQRMASQTSALFFPILAARGTCAAGNPGGFVPNPATGICTTTATEEESEETEINEHSALIGFWFRPTDELRISVDTEFMSADNTLTRISPRQFQRYDVRTTYKPKDWMNLGMVVNILEKRNNVTDVSNLQHNRNYSFNAAVLRNQNWGFDLSYSYLDVFSQSNICFVATPAPAGTVKCALAPTLLEGTSFYDSKTHFASAGLMFKPVKRVTTHLGYTGTFVNGDSLILNPNAPLGPLQLNYHLPVAGLAVELTKNWTWKGDWNHYGYNEKSEPGPTAPRDARGNVFTLALRYAF
ncbi:MAG: hypothetical protein L0Z53_22090 [Acidobacteriales bacterium]|nr:hypothetical protein [Terriglobales bacterium]